MCDLAGVGSTKDRGFIFQGADDCLDLVIRERQVPFDVVLKGVHPSRGLIVAPRDRASDPKGQNSDLPLCPSLRLFKRVRGGGANADDITNDTVASQKDSLFESFAEAGEDDFIHQRSLWLMESCRDSRA